MKHWTLRLERLAQEPDEAVFLELYDHFAPRVTSYLLRLGATTAISEELTQETMLSVWKKAALFKPERAAASTWIFTIARNQYIDAMRRHTPTAELPDEWSDEADGSLEPPEAADAWPIREALEALPLLQAQVMKLSYFEGKSHSEIASELGIPLGSVKSNIRLAFQKIRTRLRSET